MTKKTYRDFIEMPNAATEIHKELGMKKPPYDPFRIAKKLGIALDTLVSFEKLDYSGSITKHDDGSVTIWVNPVDHENRQNFTAAHEMGHLMNGDLEYGEREEFRDNASTLYRSSVKNKKEWKANEFAAELLMPEEKVRAFISKTLSDAGVKTMKAGKMVPLLAREFGVSKSAMVVRLRILGILK